MIQSPLINAIVAGLAYGGWAYYANMDHSHEASVMAAFVQGSSSFTFTLAITWVALKLYRLRHCTKQGVVIGWLGSVFLLVTLPTLLHYVAGTPNILQTIAPGIIIGSAYLLIYLLHYRKKQDIKIP